MVRDNYISTSSVGTSILDKIQRGIALVIHSLYQINIKYIYTVMLQNWFSIRNLNLAVTHALQPPKYLDFLEINVLPSSHLSFIFLPPILFRCGLSATHVVFSNISLYNVIHWLFLLLILMPQYLLNLYHS